MQVSTESGKRAIIIGAGPAGLTAAYELLTRTEIVPIVLEKSNDIGGLSRTVNYKGNRIDIGGHRFFSKSERVVSWWLQMLPLQSVPERTTRIAYRGQVAAIDTAAIGTDAEIEDKVMLVRQRRSRIYFNNCFFDYPISLTADTLKKLGLTKGLRMGLSYLRSRAFPISCEANLEHFLVNRFGRELYIAFFKDYTEKVWGVPCKEIGAEWGAQRIKGLSLSKLAAHNLRRLRARRCDSIGERDVETSLIERFMYPKFGPGQMWEEVAQRIRSMGAKVLMHWRVDRIDLADSTRIASIHATNSETGESRRFEADYVFSTMPVKELVPAVTPAAPHRIREIADGLVYREFITVGILCRRFAVRGPSGDVPTDNWIYVQEPRVMAGRLQIFNNWSPAMVADPSTVWIGLEYFCNEGDHIWQKSDSAIIELARRELAVMNLLHPQDMLDATVIRVPKAYPAYLGSYKHFSELSSWSDQIENLFLIGRNGMHKYNNQDHSMLTAMVAVDNIIGGISSRDNLWALNTEQEYQEEGRRPVRSAA